MVRRKNFAHVPVREETKFELDKLKKRLAESFNSPTYDELINLFIEKNKHTFIPKEDLKRFILKSRGVVI